MENVTENVEDLKEESTGSRKSPKTERRGTCIKDPKMERVEVLIEGDAPLVGNKFAQEAIEMMRAKQEAGSTGKKGGPREKKDFQRCRVQATRHLPDGTCGISAPAFRQAMISACRVAGIKMTLAKLSLFVEHDGFDVDDHAPLVRITKGEPQHFEAYVLNDTGVADIRARPLWEPGWQARLRIRYDADQFTKDDVVALLRRVGQQVGIGAGRPDSKRSAGQGWGTFVVVGEV